MIKSKLVSKEQCGIKLLILNGCHSYHLAKVFQPFVSSIICIHPDYEIEDEWSVAFTMHFYRNLAKVKVGNELNVLKAFQLTIADLVCRRELQPERVEEEDEEEYDDDDLKEQDSNMVQDPSKMHIRITMVILICILDGSCTILLSCSFRSSSSYSSSSSSSTLSGCNSLRQTK